MRLAICKHQHSSREGPRLWTASCTLRMRWSAGCRHSSPQHKNISDSEHTSMDLHPASTGQSPSHWCCAPSWVIVWLRELLGSPSLKLFNCFIKEANQCSQVEMHPSDPGVTPCLTSMVTHTGSSPQPVPAAMYGASEKRRTVRPVRDRKAREKGSGSLTPSPTMKIYF